MDKYNNLIAGGWKDYELLDSGNLKKLERYGGIILIRPETQALWKPKRPNVWEGARAEFSFSDKKGGWTWRKDKSEEWEMGWENAHFVVRPTAFKHTGVFPEQSSNWKFIQESVQKLEKPQVLNLFGYTGIATVVAALAGAQVTHVDASKQANAWMQKNAELSAVPKDSIRTILDDALKFAKREVRRQSTYQGIILDPPAFGRGAKNEVWHIEENLPELMETLTQLLSKDVGSFFLLNGYAAGFTPQSFLQLTQDFFSDAKVEHGEMRILETSGRQLSCGIYARFAR